MLGVMSFPALLPGFITEWQLTNTEAGWINGVYFLGYLTAVPVLVSLTDRVSPRNIYYLCLGLTAFSSAGFAFLTDGFWSAMLFRTLAGIGLAGAYMPGLKLLGNHLKAVADNKDQSRAIAFYTSSFGIGFAISYYYAGVVAEAMDWHWVFAIAIIGPLAAIATAIAALPARDPAQTEVPVTHFLDFRPVLRCRAAMGYVLAYTAHNFELFAFRSWIVTYLVFAAATGPDPHRRTAGAANHVQPTVDEQRRRDAVTPHITHRPQRPARTRIEGLDPLRSTDNQLVATVGKADQLR